MLAAELRDGTSFDPDAFSAWLDRQSDLGTKWTPSFIRLVDTIDETATGKITKVRLKLERWRCDDVVFIRQARSRAFLPASAEILDDLDARLAAR
jgi:fatty-acyl-CoA synthase